MMKIINIFLVILTLSLGANAQSIKGRWRAMPTKVTKPIVLPDSIIMTLNQDSSLLNGTIKYFYSKKKRSFEYFTLEGTYDKASGTLILQESLVEKQTRKLDVTKNALWTLKVISTDGISAIEGKAKTRWMMKNYYVDARFEQTPDWVDAAE